MSFTEEIEYKSCCDINIYPRDKQPNAKCIITYCPYFLTSNACDNCCAGCNKPGIGSSVHNPSDNECSDCALVCLPCTLVFDLLCYVPMCCNCFIIKND